MKRVVLIIESEIVPRLLYQVKFQSAGFETIAVGSGKEALALLYGQKIDIVVMDLFAKTYCSLEIMEAMIAAKPKLPILADAAIYDFWHHAHENIREVYAALAPDMKALIDEAKRLIGNTPQLRIEAQRQYLEN